MSDDPADDDANSAPTKVGPMSKAFVDRMMFKAHLAESSGVSSSRPPATESPASGQRARGTSSSAPEPAPATPALDPITPARDEEEDDGLPVFEATVQMAAAQKPPAPAPRADLAPQTRPEAVVHVVVAPSAVSPSRPPTGSFAFEVAVVLAGLAVAIAVVVHFLFP